MGLRPSSKSNPTTVSRFLDTGYDNVKKVADNIEDINSISNSIDIINQEAITQVEVIGQGYVDQAEAAKIASEQAASDSQVYSVTAINAKNESIVQAGIATDKANEALQSANESAAQAGIATTQANSAISSANAAATSESNALTSSNLAESWATSGEDTLVDGTGYSAKHYSIKASASADQASLDAQTISDQLDSTYLKTESDLRYFQVANNLSEVDPIQGRSNLELGTAATKNIGSNVGEVPDKSVLDIRLGTTGNLGTAATRDVGEVAGNVMEVGAFGLGRREQVTANGIDLDTVNLPVGFYSGNSWVNTPEGNAGGMTWYYMVVENLASGFPNFIKQTVTNIFGKRTWVRARLGGVWQEWNELYTTGNILGTVSQSGGVPTGAIIESGSNANGSYTKFADGTMICTRVTTSPACSVTVPNLFGSSSGNVFTVSGGLNLTFPVSFVNTPKVSVTSERNSTATPCSIARNGSVSGFNAYPISVVFNETVSIGYTAIGKWF